MEKEKQKQYETYVKEKTPVHNLWIDMGKAFVAGGVICIIGQIILNYCKDQGLSEEIAGSWTSLILVLISVILTVIAGLIPSKVASKKDPVIALRTE